MGAPQKRRSGDTEGGTAPTTRARGQTLLASTLAGGLGTRTHSPRALAAPLGEVNGRTEGNTRTSPLSDTLSPTLTEPVKLHRWSTRRSLGPRPQPTSASSLGCAEDLASRRAAPQGAWIARLVRAGTANMASGAAG